MIKNLLDKLAVRVGWGAGAAPAAAPAVPQQQMTIIRLDGVPPAIAQDMSADRIQQILRATEAGQSDEYLALVRDIVTGDPNVLADFAQRKTRLLSRPWQVGAADQDDQRAKRNAEVCRRQLENVPGLIAALSHLLDGSLWPVSVVEKVYAPSTVPGLRYQLARLVVVPHHLLDFREGTVRVKLTTDAGIPTGEVVDADPMRYIVHRGHLLQSLPDGWGGPARALVFWWFIAAAARGWWAQGVERNGVPFLIGKYDAANPSDKVAMMTAFRDSARRFGLVISRDTEVEMMKDLASGDAGVHQRLLEFAQTQMSRLVVGQTMTTRAQASGLGGGQQASVQNDVLTDIVQFDAELLAGTLIDQLLRSLLRINGLDGPAPTIAWQITTDDAKGMAEVLSILKQAGITMRREGEEALSKAVGLPVQLMQPEGMPAPGQGGPTGEAAPGAGGPTPTPSTVPAMQAEALNGAQVQALTDLVTRVAAGTFPVDSAIATAQAAFPAIPPPTLQGIFGPVRSFRVDPAQLTKLQADATPGSGDGGSSGSTPAAAAVDVIAAAGAADLAQAFRGTLAPVRQIVRDAKSIEDLQAKLALFYADFSPGRVASIMEEVLAACAGNAALGFRV